MLAEGKPMSNYTMNGLGRLQKGFQPKQKRLTSTAGIVDKYGYPFPQWFVSPRYPN